MHICLCVELYVSYVRGHNFKTWNAEAYIFFGQRARTHTNEKDEKAYTQCLDVETMGTLSRSSCRSTAGQQQNWRDEENWFVKEKEWPRIEREKKKTNEKHQRCRGSHQLRH